MQDESNPIFDHKHIAIREIHGIYAIQLLDSSHAAADAFMDYCEHLMKTQPDARPLRLLVVEAQDGELPMMHMRRRVRSLLRSQHTRPTFHIAILKRGSMILALFADLMRSVIPDNMDRVRIFRPDQIEEAMEWLNAETTNDL